VLDDETLANMLGGNDRKLAERKFDIKITYGTFLAIYQSLSRNSEGETTIPEEEKRIRNRVPISRLLHRARDQADKFGTQS
jgi:hypothetical protein